MSNSESAQQATATRLVIVIAIVLLLYGLSAALGWPQHATAIISGGHGEAVSHDASPPEVAEQMSPPLWTILPFALLLGAIAILPLMHWSEHWWEKNLHRFYVAAGLGGVTLLYYLLGHHHPVDRHFLGHGVAEPAAGGPSWGIVWTVLENAILNEYIPFITLLFALYTICGGIRIQGDLPAHPLTNTTFIAVGGLLASFIGTTGAAMLLIRPLLDTNSERRRIRHTVIFFIFVVCNCGGLLLPIGDPPLFLGYLRGVDFLWTLEHLWPQWLLVNGLLLAVYYTWDHFIEYPREQRADIVVDELRVRRMQFLGVWPNALLLGAVVVAVALLDPSKPLPGTEWHPWLYCREVTLLTLVGASLLFGSAKVREANSFSYAAIVEVAALFFGIFICMQPALQILDASGGSLGINTPREFFWCTGALSSVLDNAPTYVVFFETAKSLHVEGGETMAGVPVQFLIPISLGAVFLGAMTYIGNGPNFMVKAIAEQSGVKMPSFFGYMMYSFGVLLPIFLLTSWLML
jgi:Na+/H+ antiporter NhaD/arsenite permease-like protein